MPDEGRSRLGRGLAALMGDVGVETTSAPERARNQRRVPIEFLRPNPRNPRRNYPEAELVKAFIHAGKITAGAARMLVGAPDPEEMAREIVDRGLNVRQVEALAKERASSRRSATNNRAVKNADTIALERRVSDALGLAVAIDHRGEGGMLRIRYRSLDQLDHVLRRLEKN